MLHRVSAGECAQLIRRFVDENKKHMEGGDTYKPADDTFPFRRPSNIGSAAATSSNSMLLTASRPSDLSASLEWTRRVLTTIGGQTVDVHGSISSSGGPAIGIGSGNVDNESSWAIFRKWSDTARDLPASMHADNARDQQSLTAAHR